AHTDELNGTGAVRVRFQAARARADGTPDDASASALVGDVAALNVAGAGWRFVRFVVEFDAGAQGALSAAPENAPFLDFVRLPFRF
ncbi:MAG: hypothetical protein HZA53_14365, partial [Planctomycetes bacterium]|nr:hypothetical protein [Planctomycetota bacterium]